MSRITDTVKTLLLINIIFFIGSYFLGDLAFKYFALWYPSHPNFEYWQILTHMFMHGGFTHILFNMFMLYIFGSILEMYLGQQRFLFLYFSSGLGAAGLQVLFTYIGFQEAYQYYIDAGITPTQIQDILDSVVQTGQYMSYDIPQEVSNQLLNNYFSSMVGASGAVFGLSVAFAVVYPNMPLYLFFIPVPIKAKYFIGAYVLLNVYSAITGHSIIGPSNTAYWAHIGGAIIGFITMWVWKKNQFNQKRWN